MFFGETLDCMTQCQFHSLTEVRYGEGDFYGQRRPG